MIKIIILLIIYILYKVGFIGKLVGAILPFILGFVLAYVIYPLEVKLNKKIPKSLSITIIVISIILLIIGFIYILIPLLLKEGANLINIIITFMFNMSIKYNINIDIFVSKINELINYNHIINGISISFGYITDFVLCFISFIYILIDMDKIKEYVKKINIKLYNYISYINNDFSKYVGSLIKISIISFFEYMIAFLVIGHPNPLMIGLVAGMLNMIPYIGGMLTVLITILSCPTMIVKISITYIILGLIDGYIISPYVYGKYNKINPLVGLIALSIGGIFGFMGVVASFPILILILSTINYIKDNNIDISIIWKR